MKSSLAIVSLLAVVFIAGRLSHQISAKAATLGAGTTDAPVGGDLNDDSSADSSDASHLLSLVDYGRTSPSIDPIFSSLTSIHWTSTPDTGMPVNAWVVSSSRGVVESHDRADNHLFVRAVRSSGPQE